MNVPIYKFNYFRGIKCGLFKGMKVEIEKILIN